MARRSTYNAQEVLQMVLDIGRSDDELSDLDDSNLKFRKRVISVMMDHVSYR